MGFYPYGQQNYNNMNYNAYQPNFQQPIQQMPAQQGQPQNSNIPKTNKIFVQSLDVALSMPTEPNSVVIYLHQDLPLLFEISTDFFGRKTSRTFELTESNQKSEQKITADLSAYVTKEEYKTVESRLEHIEAILNNSKNAKKTIKDSEEKE